ncbi:MAG: transglutaminase domain-containing protein [Alistipes sp.]
MKKFAKITGIVLFSLIGVLIVLFLLSRYVFREQVVDYLTEQQQNERVELLRNANPYAADTTQFRFTYTQDTLHAQALRTYFRLDTLLRADAPTWDNAVALAKFVAGNIPHANQTVYPEKSNAIALWEYHLNIEPAFNCRLHSILLHELLLASGIANRFVTCMPYDPEDNDCHVVNIVWLPELQKWAMIDSDMQAYITAPDQTPLSLEEMRRRYIAEEPMIIHRLLDTKNDNYYASYWAKNLYWFQCWEQTGYDKEPSKEGRMIVLIPPGFEGFKMRDQGVKTSDPARFWAAPIIE